MRSIGLVAFEKTTTAGSVDRLRYSFRKPLVNMLEAGAPRSWRQFEPSGVAGNYIPSLSHSRVRKAKCSRRLAATCRTQNTKSPSLGPVTHTRLERRKTGGFVLECILAASRRSPVVSIFSSLSFKRGAPRAGSAVDTYIPPHPQSLGVLFCLRAGVFRDHRTGGWDICGAFSGASEGFTKLCVRTDFLYIVCAFFRVWGGGGGIRGILALPLADLRSDPRERHCKGGTYTHT